MFEILPTFWFVGDKKLRDWTVTCKFGVWIGIAELIPLRGGGGGGGGGKSNAVRLEEATRGAVTGETIGALFVTADFLQ